MMLFLIPTVLHCINECRKPAQRKLDYSKEKNYVERICMVKRENRICVTWGLGCLERMHFKEPVLYTHESYEFIPEHALSLPWVSGWSIEELEPAGQSE